MMLFKKPITTLLFSVFALVCSAQIDKVLPVKVFVLGGQSNMDGVGHTDELPENYKIPPVNVITWDNTKKKWVPVGTDSFAIRRKEFGPELAFSHLLAEKYPNYTIAIVKTSAGGTKLWKHWLPQQPMYNSFFRNLDNSLKVLKAESLTYDISGMLWMQGESDAETMEYASVYAQNLKVLFKSIRLQTKKENLPIVMGRISSGLLRKTPWNFDFTKVVQEQQDKVAAEDKNVFIINTDKLGTWKDNTHFNTKSQLWLGKKMGKLMIKAIK